MVEIDIRGIWEALQAQAEKGLPRRKPLTNEQQWILWEMWGKRTQSLLARAIHIGNERLKEEYLALKEAGGPKGEKPEWMA